VMRYGIFYFKKGRKLEPDISGKVCMVEDVDRINFDEMTEYEYRRYYRSSAVFVVG
jgi:hypothetical protein